MRFTLLKNTVLLFIFLVFSCGSTTKSDVGNNSTTTVLSNIKNDTTPKVKPPIIVGANQMQEYLSQLKDKRVGIVANQTSVIFKNNDTYKHLVDSLVSLDIDVKKVFAPEHGFRGNADAGELVTDGLDTKTGLPIISFYGKNKKPSQEQLQGLDVLIFDIQDVGARFYTYISSLHYIMEACAEQNIPMLILDRPNPNGHYIDGPILEKEHTSFIGMHPIPVVHGMTIGEYAQMINGEGWLTNKVICDITIIPVKNYTHESTYSLPIKPSPNLPNDIAINLYPSLCFLEGTNVSVGRGTSQQFQIYGAPTFPKTNYTFTPQPNLGSKYPKHKNVLCNGYNLTTTPRLGHIDLSYLINAYAITEDKSSFFMSNGFFTKLAGTKTLQQQIENGLTEVQIKATWVSGLENFKTIRKSYLLYD